MARGDYITQFMWGYQRHFRIRVELEARRLLEGIGLHSRTSIILVGFQVSGVHEHPICIEPEDGEWNPSELANVNARAELLYEAHPESSTYYGAGHIREEKRRQLRDRMRGSAIAEALGATPAGNGRTFFASESARVGDYDVYVIMSIESDALAQVPMLQKVDDTHGFTAPSIVHAVIVELLRQARRELYVPDAGHHTDGIGYGVPEIWQRATLRMLQTAFDCAGHAAGGTTDKYLASVSLLFYEGRPSAGQVIISLKDHKAVQTVIHLRDPVHLSRTRAVRKLLEASGDGLGLLIDDQAVYGLGHVLDAYVPESEEIFTIDVGRSGSWSLATGTQALFSVLDGIPHLPRSVLDVNRLTDTIARRLTDADMPMLLALAQAAGKHSHGAMLVISNAAAAEAARLAPQVWQVEPVQLSPTVMTQLTNMDGAVLIDAQGRCHALGVILDGLAAGDGDPSRGSRYNNAVRYLTSDVPPAVVISYSADGDIDIMPKLEPRIDRLTVESTVNRYVAALQARPPRMDDVVDYADEVEAIRFYLSAEQCQAINEARHALNDWQAENNEVVTGRQPLAPDPQMDDSYWLPDSD